MKYLYTNQAVINGPWGGGNAFIRALYELAPEFGWTVTNDASYIRSGTPVLCTALSGDGGLSFPSLLTMRANSLKHRGRDIPIILRCNENDARKGTTYVDSAWRSAFDHSQKVLFVSRWQQSYFGSSGEKYSVLINGVDTDIFSQIERVKSDRPTVVAHHWSDNPLKGSDVYAYLDRLAKDKIIDFTYIGRIRSQLQSTKIIAPLHGEELGKALANHDVYVSGSRFDPGPNHILEALACGLPTYVHRDGGGCVEFAGEDHVYSDTETLLKQIMSPKKNETRLFTWRECIMNLIKEVESLEC